MPTIASVHRAQGMAEALLLQLEKRFGPLPTARAFQVAKASEAEVERWLLRVLDARDLDELFQSPEARDRG